MATFIFRERAFRKTTLSGREFEKRGILLRKNQDSSVIAILL
jgi:hypothetical protein